MIEPGKGARAICDMLADRLRDRLDRVRSKSQAWEEFKADLVAFYAPCRVIDVHQDRDKISITTDASAISFYVPPIYVGIDPAAPNGDEAAITIRHEDGTVEAFSWDEALIERLSGHKNPK